MSQDKLEYLIYESMLLFPAEQKNSELSTSDDSGEGRKRVADMSNLVAKYVEGAEPMKVLRLKKRMFRNTNKKSDTSPDWRGDNCGMAYQSREARNGKEWEELNITINIPWEIIEAIVAAGHGESFMSAFDNLKDSCNA